MNLLFSTKLSWSRTGLVLACMLGASFAVACKPEEVLKNPEIERWCGNRPCNWQVTGRVERVGSWHSDDYALAMLSDHATLSQRSPLDGNFFGCFKVSMLAKVEDGVTLTLAVDFGPTDGVEWTRRIPTSTDYEDLRFAIDPPSWFDGATFTLRKDGHGRADIAKLRVVNDDDGSCDALGQVDLEGRPGGAACERDGDCLSGDCRSGACTCPPSGAGVEAGAACICDTAQENDAGTCQ